MSKILIVEDDENILELEKDYIEASNMEAQGATNGNDGLELALNNDYDLILLDVMLPGINGFDICKKIRETKNTPVIFVTAKRDEIDKISGLFKNTGEAFVGDKEITLTKKEFEVLYILASHPNTIYSKAELFESVWGYDSLGDTSTLTVHINRLRDKIKEADENTDCIKTIWGRGYKFK